MNREKAKATIRSRVVVNAQHIKSLHSVDEVIDQLCDEHEDRMREKDIEIESLQSEKKHLEKVYERFYKKEGISI